MPRPAKAATISAPQKTLVVDNGGYSIKAGFATENATLDDCREIPNCIARSNDKKIYIGSDLAKCRDFREAVFRRPVEKGYVVNWEGEKAIWDHEFLGPASGLKCDPTDTTLILTEAPNSLPSLSTNCDQMVFEEYNFAAYYRALGPTLPAYNDTNTLFNDPPLPSSPFATESLIVVDSGYSHTTITPLYQGQPLHPAIRRLTIGGKFLTNYLKDIISTRSLYLMEEPHLANQIKEDVCFASLDFARDMTLTWKLGRKAAPPPGTESLNIDYVLPDYTTRHRGLLRPYDPSKAAQLARLAVSNPGPQAPREDVVALGNERFTVPELLFHPSDVGFKELGLAPAIMESLSQIDPALHPGLLANVLVVGGNARIPGLVERLQMELRGLAPQGMPVRVASPQDPVGYAWMGGVRLAGDREALGGVVVSRAEYEEHGAARVARRFARGRW